MSIKHISVVIIVKNAEETIAEYLAALVRFSEVIVYCNHSTDNTMEIARGFANVKLIEGDFEGFGKTKKMASEAAKHDWILSLDSDEILNDRLIDEIAAIDITQTQRVYVLKRENYFLGAKTVSKDYIVRLYHRTFTNYNDALVHEKVLVPEGAERVSLKQGFKHLNITDINQTLTKMIHYTDLGAKKKKICFFPIVIAKATFAFIQTYILRLYFLNGWRGFVIAISNANRRFYKYLKQYIHCQEA